MKTKAFEQFIAPAKRYPAIWRLVLGCVTAIVVYMFVAVIFASLTTAVLSEIFSSTFPDMLDRYTLDAVLGNGSTPGEMFVILTTFIGMGLGTIFACFWHWRGVRSLIGPFVPACRNFTLAVISCIVVFAVLGFLASLFFDDPVPNLKFSQWISFLPFALPLLFIQIGSEELFFRGYLMQQLAARFSNAFIWMGIPTLLFGAAHYDNTLDPVLTITVVLATGLFGLIAADLTRLTGNLGAAFGIHLVNNFFALFIVSIEGELSGLSLFLAPFSMDDVGTLLPLMLIDIVSLMIVWIWLRRNFRA